MMSTDITVSSATESAPAKEPLKFGASEWGWALAFMLSMSMVGLQFPLGRPLVIAIMIARFIKNRYDFLIELFLVFGSYSLASSHDWGVSMIIVITAVSLAGILLLRKTPMLRKLLLLTAGYALIILFLALKSDESLSVQMVGILNYMCIISFVIPIMVFSGREFDIRYFWRKAFLYAFIFCIFYIIDCCIFNGLFLLPRDVAYIDYDNLNTWLNPFIFPFSGWFPRRWPLGLFIFGLCIYPAARYYKLNWWQIALVLAALAISRTFTLVVALVVVYVFSQRSIGKVSRYVMIGAAALTVMYFVDMAITGPIIGENDSSALRIQSQIDQIINMGEIKDDEDLSKLGTGRMAQVIPKVMLLYDLGREWIGFGFLSRTQTTNSKYIIENEYYLNPEDAEEVAVGVEIMAVDVLLNIGWIGLIAHILYFVALWWVVRPLRYSGYFTSVMCFFVIMGIAGFSGLVFITGLALVGLSLGVVICVNKPDLKGFSLPKKNRNFAGDGIA